MKMISVGELVKEKIMWKIRSFLYDLKTFRTMTVCHPEDPSIIYHIIWQVVLKIVCEK